MFSSILYSNEQDNLTSQDNFELFSADGYRILRYRSPTPAKTIYAESISTQQLVLLMKSKNPLFLLDVQPTQWNQVFIEKEERFHLPGSTWLPNVGAGELDDDWYEYFRVNLENITQGNKGAAVVIYCRADCWMSWNAIKRASEWGYTQLYWYRNGTDGWAEYDLEFVRAIPVSFTKSD